MGGIKPVLSTVTVTTAATRVQLSTAVAPSFYVEAHKSNTGNVYLGDITVSATVYSAKLAPGQGFSMAADNPSRPILTELDLSVLYVDADTNGNKLQLTRLTRVGG